MSLAVRLGVVALAASCVLAPGAASPADFPSKPLRIIVPFPPGGFNDQLARTLGQKFAGRWRQPVVVDNRAGGSTLVGTDLAAKAPPDGHAAGRVVRFRRQPEPAHTPAVRHAQGFRAGRAGRRARTSWWPIATCR
jgi:tripartite-type tricarboxylate transporter receptor subunit TctC